MHWIERGPEPDGLANVKAKYTEGWVQRYRHKVGKKPRDTAWTKFMDDLRRVFCGICAYCETRCRGEVEHFHPKSKSPELVYVWSNWLFACHDCNFSKGKRAAGGTYVNPCARFWFGHPERYFTFNTKTGRICPQKGLNQGSKEKAQRTICDLRLNDPHHMKNRGEWIDMISGLAIDETGKIRADCREELAHLASRGSPWSSVVRLWLSEREYSVGDLV